LSIVASNDSAHSPDSSLHAGQLRQQLLAPVVVASVWRVASLSPDTVWWRS
jgi:hypothetical protein